VNFRVSPTRFRTGSQNNCSSNVLGYVYKNVIVTGCSCMPSIYGLNGSRRYDFEYARNIVSSVWCGIMHEYVKFIMFIECV
jgi:hypothetical protein